MNILPRISICDDLKILCFEIANFLNPQTVISKRKANNKIMELFKLFRTLLCKIGLHKVEEYQDKFREGEFYCKYCKKHMDYPY